MRTFSFLSALLLILISCNDSITVSDEQHKILSEYLNLPQEVYDYTPQVTQALVNEFPDINDSQERDEVHDHMATMGRVLFYDTRLSKDHSVSCASCHKQEHAFADNVPLSRGINNRVGTRNSLALGTTMGFETSYGQNFEIPVSGAFAQFSWDDSVFDLTEQSIRAIESEVEMDMHLPEIIKRLGSDPAYGILMKNAFGSSQVSEHELLLALRSFMNSFSTVHSKFDKGLEAVNNRPEIPFPNFNTSENLGKELFNRDCSGCHGRSHTFTELAVSNNGLDLNYTDNGKGDITKRQEDMGVFKIPFLRNIEVTAPYMHDGRFSTLTEVIDHYSSNVQPHENLGFSLKDQNGQPKKLNYSEIEKIALVDYLHTLTDLDFLKDERFTNPFK